MSSGVSATPGAHRINRPQPSHGADGCYLEVSAELGMQGGTCRSDTAEPFTPHFVSLSSFFLSQVCRKYCPDTTSLINSFELAGLRAPLFKSGDYKLFPAQLLLEHSSRAFLHVSEGRQGLRPTVWFRHIHGCLCAQFNKKKCPFCCPVIKY